MNENLTLGCILLFNADHHLLAHFPISGHSAVASVADQDRMQLAGVPHFAAVINADGDVIGGGPIDRHTIQIPHFREFAQDLIRRLDAE
jgi:hypothetical protein